MNSIRQVRNELTYRQIQDKRHRQDVGLAWLFGLFCGVLLCAAAVVVMSLFA